MLAARPAFLFLVHGLPDRPAVERVHLTAAAAREHVLRERDGPDRPLSVVMVAMLGKAMKTFAAIERLCLIGYGEDAAVLLRTNVNLLINTAYIVTDEKPNDRAAEDIADAWRRFRTFMREASGKDVDAADLPFPADRLSELSERWRAVTIDNRAKKIPEHRYETSPNSRWRRLPARATQADHSRERRPFRLTDRLSPPPRCPSCRANTRALTFRTLGTGPCWFAQRHGAATSDSTSVVGIAIVVEMQSAQMRRSRTSRERSAIGAGTP